MKKGFWGLSPVLDTMLKNRVFKEGSVDAVLQDEAILVEAFDIMTLSQAPNVEKWCFKAIGKARPLLKNISEQILGKSKDKLDYLHKLAEYTSTIANIFPIKHQPNYSFYPKPDDYFWGGTEEMLITKGTDWCGEVARVFCSIAQMAEIPTRIVYTYSDDDGHVINDAYLDRKWILVDSTNGFLYKSNENDFLGIKDYVLNREIFKDALKFYADYYYSKIDYFKYIAVSEYLLAESEKYDYRISFCNEYYRDVLKNAWNN